MPEQGRVVLRGAWKLPAAPKPAPVCVAVEEPLEIRVAQETVAITMRTPGDDGRLAVGFLFAEGVLSSIDEVASVAHCGRPGDEGFGNTIEVTPAPGARLVLERLEPARRGTLTTSACGVCGRKSIDDLLQSTGPLPPGPTLSAEQFLGAVKKLSATQAVFSRTGGTHAAAAFDERGELLASFEDVGRHNAVDKLVGELLYARKVPRPEQGAFAAILAVSGRASFEIIQKAARAGIPAVASVSAPSSLAVDLARRAHLTLACFVRDGELTLYTGAERLGLASPS